MQTGERFDKFLIFVVDKLFSAATLAIIAALAFVYTMFYIVGVESVRSDEYRKIVEYCYSQEMVVVHTDAGKRCVSPANLVKPK